MCTTKSKAFTLSEVLITLGIIGVVAAITMPVLIANIQQDVLNNRWKKAYSEINQAYLLVQAEEDLDNYYNCNVNLCFRPVIEKIIVKYKSAQLNDKYYNGEKISEASFIPKYTDINGNKIDASNIFARGYFMNDIYIYYWSYYPQGGAIWVDVNAHKGPNKIGKDLFALEIKKNRIYPFGQFATGDWCKGKSGNLGVDHFQSMTSNYYAGIGCSYEVLYGKKI